MFDLLEPNACTVVDFFCCGSGCVYHQVIKDHVMQRDTDRLKGRQVNTIDVFKCN